MPCRPSRSAERLRGIGDDLRLWRNSQFAGGASHRPNPTGSISCEGVEASFCPGDELDQSLPSAKRTNHGDYCGGSTNQAGKIGSPLPCFPLRRGKSTTVSSQANIGAIKNISKSIDSLPEFDILPVRGLPSETTCKLHIRGAALASLGSSRFCICHKPVDIARWLTGVLSKHMPTGCADRLSRGSNRCRCGFEIVNLNGFRRLPNGHLCRRHRSSGPPQPRRGDTPRFQSTHSSRPEHDHQRSCTTDAGSAVLHQFASRLHSAF
jgi:hypothetical protein